MNVVDSGLAPAVKVTSAPSTGAEASVTVPMTTAPDVSNVLRKSVPIARPRASSMSLLKKTSMTLRGKRKDGAVSVSSSRSRENAPTDGDVGSAGAHRDAPE